MTVAFSVLWWFKYLDVDGRMRLKWTLIKWDMRVYDLVVDSCGHCKKYY
jgi:hypothetical protein